MEQLLIPWEHHPEANSEKKRPEDYEDKKRRECKFFNNCIFKLVVLFERVRFYEKDIIHPRDNKLNEIEVNFE